MSPEYASFVTLGFWLVALVPWVLIARRLSKRPLSEDDQAHIYWAADLLNDRQPVTREYHEMFSEPPSLGAGYDNWKLQASPDYSGEEP